MLGLSDSSNRSKFKSFLFIGIWNSIFGIGNFLILYDIFANLHYSLILTISYTLSVIQSHYSQRKFVWRSSAPYLGELMKFSTANFVQFLLNALLLFVAVESLTLDARLSQIAITGNLILLNFAVAQRYVFRGDRYENPQ